MLLFPHCFSSSSCQWAVPPHSAAIPLSVVLLFVLLSTAVQLHCSAAAVLPPQGPNEAGPILLSRYGRAAAVLSRYGKRDGGPAEQREFEGGVGAGPWFLCKLTLDGQFLRCRSPLQRRKK